MSDLKKQLRQLDVSKLIMKNGCTVENEMIRHSKILADCIMEELNDVYESYSPKIYERRNHGLYDSLYIDDAIRVDVSSKGTSLSIGLHFDNGAINQNFNGDDVNVAGLLNEGWSWKNSTVDIPYLSRREGTRFIDKGIEKYKRKVRNPFTVRFTINDEERMF